ncbi:hypothetical protein [Legionella sainthelensi]|uniref:Uncharacterized protein n=1 Tax=Legionella sainthelensi TaxID=28087 RepID=A0A2H5FIB6_9GAMM|nr:hypothetical protein [Legionella sainthelensi]AUH71292.1 hypothetical protein CAB17_03855 [Legionella sainthelensi]
MAIPKKALRHSQFITKTPISDGSHKVYSVSFEEEGITKKAFFKELEPQRHYPELLAKISVATSSFKRSFQGKRSAEERLVFDEDDHLIGTLSICVDNFKPFHYAEDGIPVNSTLREQVAPSVKTLVEKNFIELLFGRWFLDDDDAHPHNLSLDADIDFDMFFYWFTIHMKEPRSVIGIPKKHVFLSVPDYEAFPNVQDSKPYHWAPYTHPGKVTIPVLLPGQEQVLPKLLPKAYADPVQFARLAQDSVAQEQKLAAALKALLTYQPDVQRKRLTELFGDLTLNYTSLDETNKELRAKYEELYPDLCNEMTNSEPFVDFMMKLYQEHYDNLYRVVVFYMGCVNNGYGIPLPPTCLALYQKPSFYRNIEEWVNNENDTTYAKEGELKYDPAELQKRYHQVWRDAFAPTLKELLHSSYRLVNTLLQKTTNPPHVQISEIISKKITDDSLTNAWELFGNMPELATEAIEEKISVDKESNLRDALLALVAFTNEFRAITKDYYIKERKDLTEEHNLEFSTKLTLLHQKYNLDIRKVLANTTPCAVEFHNLSSSLKLIAEQVNFPLHLTTTDELMEEALLSVKKDVLPFTHDDVKKQYHDSLFIWAKNLKPEELERYVTEIIDKKYAPLLSTFSFRQRTEPVKEYLRESTNESGDNRLAYILSSGSQQDGALNRLIIEGLTPLMLQEHPIPSIDVAIRDKSFERGIADFTRDVVFFAKKDKRFTHSFSDMGISSIYRAVYDWVDTLTEKSFQSLIKSSLKQYESKTWGSYWGSSRRSEVEGYLKGNCNSRALAMIFMNGFDSSTLNECLFTKIVETIKKEFASGEFPAMQQDPKYQLVANFNLEKHKAFYLANLKHHSETITASHRQLQITYSLTH